MARYTSKNLKADVAALNQKYAKRGKAMFEVNKAYGGFSVDVVAKPRYTKYFSGAGDVGGIGHVSARKAISRVQKAHAQDPKYLKGRLQTYTGIVNSRIKEHKGK